MLSDDNIIVIVNNTSTPHNNRYRAAARRHSGRTGGWVAVAEAICNSGTYQWAVPTKAQPGAVEVRIRAAADVRVHDVLELSLH